MLASQRAHFAIPRDVAYLNAAAWSPLPNAVVAAGHAGVERKAQPWRLDADHDAQQFARARQAAASLIGADANDIALIPSVGYGVSTAAKLLPIPDGARVLLLAEDHSSPTLEWIERARAGRFTIDTVPQPADGDWTAAVLAAIARPGAPPLALASISSVHWSDGGLLDMHAIAASLRQQGAALLVDATHSVGVIPTEVTTLDPDFLIFPTYKWVLGPYGRAFLYVAPRHQDGVPLEQTSASRRGVSATQTPYLGDLRYVDGARRFDMGERDHFISLEMAAVGMELMAGWGAAAIQARLAMLTTRLIAALGDADVTIPATRVRAPHVLSVGFPRGMPAGLIDALAVRHCYAAPRLGRLRISPHVYNDEADIDTFADALRTLCRGSDA